MLKRMLTPAEYGADYGIGGRWIRYLCKAGRIPGARQLGVGKRAQWAIPEGAKMPILKVGRPKEKKKK